MPLEATAGGIGSTAQGGGSGSGKISPLRASARLMAATAAAIACSGSASADANRMAAKTPSRSFAPIAAPSSRARSSSRSISSSPMRCSSLTTSLAAASTCSRHRSTSLTESAGCGAVRAAGTAPLFIRGFWVRSPGGPQCASVPSADG
jgi:hypothetical protein